jgi:hypothetical protein
MSAKGSIERNLEFYDREPLRKRAKIPQFAVAVLQITVEVKDDQLWMAEGAFVVEADLPG